MTNDNTTEEQNERDLLDEITYYVMDMHGEPHYVIYPEDVKKYTSQLQQEVERLKERNEYLTDVIKIAITHNPASHTYKILLKALTSENQTKEI